MTYSRFESNYNSLEVCGHWKSYSFHLAATQIIIFTNNYALAKNQQAMQITTSSPRFMQIDIR